MTDIVITAIVAIIVFITVTRAIGSWMLRINEIIDHQKSMIDQQQKIIEGLRDVKHSIDKNSLNRPL